MQRNRLYLVMEKRVRGKCVIDKEDERYRVTILIVATVNLPALSRLQEDIFRSLNSGGWVMQSDTSSRAEPQCEAPRGIANHDDARLATVLRRIAIRTTHVELRTM